MCSSNVSCLVFTNGNYEHPSFEFHPDRHASFLIDGERGAKLTNGEINGHVGSN